MHSWVQEVSWTVLPTTGACLRLREHATHRIHEAHARFTETDPGGPHCGGSSRPPEAHPTRGTEACSHKACALTGSGPRRKRDQRHAAASPCFSARRGDEAKGCFRPVCPRDVCLPRCTLPATLRARAGALWPPPRDPGVRTACRGSCPACPEGRPP